MDNSFFFAIYKLNSKQTQSNLFLSRNTFFCRVIVFAFLFLFQLNSHAQLASNYSFSTNNNGSLLLDMNSNFLDMSVGTGQLIGPGQDNILSAQTNIGFDFYFMGAGMNTFSCSDNGLIELGNRTLPVTLYNPSLNSIPNLLSPYAKNLQVGTNGEVRYKLFGSAPDRVLVIEYFNVMISSLSAGGATPGTAVFQVRLYETTGAFEFMYGTMLTNGSTQNNSTAEIGWLQSTSSNKFMSVGSVNLPSTSGAWLSFVAPLNSSVSHLNSSSNANRRYYRFIPPQTLIDPPNQLVTSSISASSVTLNWTDNSINEKSFNVFKSVDSVNFSRIALITSSSTGSIGTGYSQIVSGLTSTTPYSFRVVANTEGVASPPVYLPATTSNAKTYHWVGNGATLFTDPQNWIPLRYVADPSDTLYFDNGSNSVINNVSTQSISAIIVTSNTSVIFQSASPAVLTLLSKTNNALRIESGSALSLSSTSSITLTYLSGLLGMATINGKFSLEVNSTYNTTFCTTVVNGTLESAGIITGSSSSLLSFTGNAIYNHRYSTTPGIIPVATWVSGSTCLISGYTTNTTGPGGLTGQSFSNFTWSCQLQTGALSLSGNIPNSIGGVFSILNTNSGSLSIATTQSPLMTINNFNQSGGVFQLNTVSGSTIMKVSGSFIHSGGVFVSSSTGTPILEFNGVNGIQNVIFNNSAPRGSLTYKISNSAGINLFGTGSLTINFIINSGGGIRIATAAIIPIVTSLNIFYNSFGTSLIYESPASRSALSKEFPLQSGPFAVVVNMPGYVLTMPFTRILNGSLTMTAGDIDIGSNSITIGNSPGVPGSLIWTSGNIRVTSGSMTRWFSTTGFPSVPGTGIGFFPLASGLDNRNVSLYGTSQFTAGGFVTITHSNIPGITSGLSVADGSYIIKRRTNSSWNFITGGLVAAGNTLGMRITGANLFTTSLVSNLRLMKSSTIAGNYVQGTGFIPNYRAERTALSIADINSSFYIGTEDNNMDAIFIAIANGNWSNGNIWSSGTAPSILNNASIASGVQVFLDVTGQCKSIGLNPGATLTTSAHLLSVDSIIVNNGNINISGGDIIINGGTNSGQGLTTAGGSVFTISAGTLTIGPTGGGNKRWINSGGTINVDDGVITVNGNVLISGGRFNQTSGNLIIDCNDGVSAFSSMPDGSSIFQVTDGILSCNAGAITIVDPPFNTSITSRAVSLNGAVTDTNAFSGTHTFIFGDGFSNTSGNANNGFVIDTKENSVGRIPIKNVWIKSGNAPGRFVRNTLSSVNGTHILGDITINNGSIYRVISGTGGKDCFGGNINNNGTMICTQGITLGGELGIYQINNSQNISGTGIFINSLGSSTAGFNGLSINNKGGINNLFGDLSNSGTIGFIKGNLNMGSYTFAMMAGSAISGIPSVNSHVSGRFSQFIPTGSFSALFPIGDSVSYTPVIFSGSPGAVISSGDIAVSTIGNEHPGIISSGINSVKDVNRYFIADALNGITFSPGLLTAVLRWKTVDVDSGATRSSFVVSKTNSTGWIFPSTGVRTDSSVQSFNISSLGDFVIGEPCRSFNILSSVIHPSCSGLSNGAITLNIPPGFQNYTFQWSGPINFSSATKNITSLIPGVYNVLVTGEGGCTSAYSIAVNNPSTVSYTNQIIKVSCLGANDGRIIFTASGGLMPYSFSIDSGLSFQSSNVFNGLTAGTYSSVVKDSSGCLSVIRQVIVSQPLATLSFIKIETPVTCYGGINGAIQLFASGGVSPYVYSIGGNNFQQSNLFIGLSAGTYQLSIKDSGGCITPPVSVSLGSASPVIFSTSVTGLICVTGSKGSLDVQNVSGGNGSPYSYSIDSGVNFRASSFFDSLSAGTYNVRVKDSIGCQSVVVPASVLPSSQLFIITASAGSNGSISQVGAVNITCSSDKMFSFTPDICFEVADVLVDGFPVGALSSYSFLNVQASHTIDVSFRRKILTIQSSAGINGTITPFGSISVVCGDSMQYSITPANGFIVDTLLVDGQKIPSALSYLFNNVQINHSIYVTFTNCLNPSLVNAGNDVKICAGSSVVLSGSIGGSASSASWSSSGTGTFFPDAIFGHPISYQPSLADISTGSIRLTLTTDDPLGICNAASDYLILNIRPLPVITISGRHGYCIGDSTTLGINSIYQNGSLIDYKWKRNGLFINVATHSTFITTAIGNYSVVITDSLGCINESALFNVQEFPLPSPPQIVPTGNVAICTGSSRMLTSNKLLGNHWIPGGDTTQQISVSGQGIYAAIYRDTNGCASISSDTVHISLLPLPVVSIISDSSLCLGNTLSFIGSSATGVFYSWSGPNNFSSIVTSPSFPVSYSDSGLYTLTVTDTYGCTGIAQKQIHIDSLPTVMISGSQVLCTGASNILSSLSTPGTGSISTYQWKFSGTPITSAINSNYVAYQPGSYSLSVTNSKGCSALSASFLISKDISPLVGNYTISNAPASCVNYNSFANVFNDINSRGISGPVTINVSSGFVETAPSLGFQIKMCSLPIGLQSGMQRPIVFIKTGSGVNPLIIAGQGSSSLDAAVKIIGGDFITFDGIDLQDPVGNVNANSQMEWGYALLKCDGSKGSRNNTIKNCKITLQKINTSSVGIYLGNHNEYSTTSLLYSGLFGGDSFFRSSNNMFYGNAISNVYTGISLNGSLSYSDSLNVVGNSLMSANTITNFGGGANSVNGIVVTGQKDIKISRNNINGGIGSTLTVNGIYIPSSVPFSGEIKENIISLTSSSAGANALSGINVGSVTNGDALILTGNTIQSCSYSTGTASSFNGIISSFSGTGLVNISNNVIQNNFISTALTGGFIGIGITGSPGLLNISSNIVSGNQLSGTGVFNGLSIGNNTGEINATGNVIQNNQKTGSGGTMNCVIFSSPSEYIFSENVISNNFIPAASGTFPSVVLGMSNQSATVGENISNNVFRKLYINGSATGSQNVMGIRANNNASTRFISGNTIDSLFSETSATINGISTGLAGGAVNISKNKIYNLTGGGSTSIVNGILATNAPPSVLISNNLIGELKSPFGVNANAIKGIDISGTTNVNVFFNTVYLSATGNGSTFGTSAISAAASSTLDMRNNIFINKSQPGGSGGIGGVTAAYRRNINNLTSYSNASDNNLFYSGTPGSNNLIYCEGLTGTVTNAQQTISGYKNLAGLFPRDQRSVTEDVSFLSNAGNNPLYLHINPSNLTLVEGNAMPLNIVTDDYDSNVRSTTNPDIGADEGAFTGLGPSISAVSVNPGSGQCVSTSHTVNATVISGLNSVTSVTLIYTYDGTSQSQVTMTNNSGNNWTGIIPPGAPANAMVNWSVLASDGIYAQSATGFYRDEILTQYNLTLDASATPTFVCTSGNTQLNANVIGNGATLSTYCIPIHTSSTNCIYSVQFNSLSVNSSLPGGCALPAYTLYPATGNSTTSVIKGRSYSLTVVSSISSMVWVWFDFNRNGIFENTEATLVYSTGTYGSINILIPSSASIGGIRMRLRSTVANGVLNKSQACATMNTGETEDYIINIVPEITYLWTPSGGLNDSSIFNPIANVSSNAVYTVSAYDVYGCTLPVLTKTLSIPVLLPPQPPGAVNSVQCGSGVPACSVIGTGIAYNWYLSSSGGMPLQIGNSSLSNYSIDATTTFYVSQTDGNCESQRTPVIATVSLPDSVSINVSSPACTNNPILLRANKYGTGNNYIYSWSALPSAQSGIFGNVFGDTVSVIPTAAGTYLYGVVATDTSQHCTKLATVNVIVIKSPEITSLTSTSLPLCQGGTAVLKGLSALPGMAFLGNGSLRNSRTNGWPTPYGGYYGGTKSQYLIRASELTAAGLYAGPITSLRFTIIQLATTTTFTGYTIRMGHSLTNSLTSNFESSPLADVYGPVNYSPVPGFNTHNFSTPFIWDGVSNLLIEICFNNNSTLNTTGNAVCISSATSYNSSIHYGDNLNSVVCFIPSVLGSQTQRPNMGIGGQVYSSGTGILTWNWQPGNISGSTVSVMPSSNTSYTTTVTNINTSCSLSTSLSITVFPVPPSPNSTDSIHCGASVPNCFVAGTGGLFHWYLTPSGGNFISGETGESLTSYVSGTTSTFYVAEFDGSCESSRIPVHEISLLTDSVKALVSPGPYCSGKQFQLSAIHYGSNNIYTYSWTANPTAGSGIHDTAFGQTISVSPLLPGTYSYTINAFDGTCTAISTVTIVVNPIPIITSVSSNVSTVCRLSPVTLSGKSFEITSPVAIIGTGLSQNTAGTYPTPYGHTFGGAKEQYLILASEMVSAGLQSGNIFSLAFDVVSIPPGGTNLMNNFTISMGATNLTSLPAVIQNGISGLTQLLIPSDYYVTPGINTHTFNTPFFWNGNSNVIVEVCFNNGDLGAGNIGSAIVRQSATGFVSTIEYHLSSSPDVCTAVGGATINSFSQRPNILLGGLVGIDRTSTLSWNWNPGNISGAGVTAFPNVSGLSSYVVTATNNYGCVSKDSLSLNVLQLPSGVNVFDSSHCGNAVPLCHVSSQGNLFHWYLQSAGGTELSAENNSSLLSYPASRTTIFYVSVSDSTCESLRSAVTEFVSPADSVFISSANSICQNSSITLNANQIGNTNNYSYSWNSDSGGGLLTANGSVVSAVPSVAGTITYTVKASDSVTGCNWISKTNINSLLVPSVSITPMNDSICLGSGKILNASASLAGKALQLNGINQFMLIPPSAGLNLVKDFTIEAWIYPTSLGDGKGIISKNQSFSTGSYFLRIGTVSPYTGLSAGGYTETGVPLGILTVNSWYHVAVVFNNLSGNNNSVTVYVNGNVASTGQSLVYANSDSLRIGVDYGGKYFNGLIDEVRIWNAPLSASTIQTWKNKPISFLHPQYSELKGYYDFNFPNQLSIKDNSGNGNDGTIKNNAQIVNSTAPLSVGFQYSWTPANEMNNALSQNPLVTPTSSGNHLYSLVTTAPNGCTASSSANIFSVTSPVSAVISSSVSPAVFCNSGSAVLTFQNPQSSYSYQWQLSSDNINWNNISGATSSVLNTSVISSTTYFRLKVICGSSVFSNVLVFQITSPSITSTTSAVRCGTGTMILNATGNGTIDWYANSTGGSPLASGNTYQPSVTSTRTFWVDAHIGTCYFTGGRMPVVASIKSPPAITAAATAYSICRGLGTSLSVNSPNDPNYTYLWSPGNQSGSSFNVMPLSSIIYTVLASDNTSGPNSGCTVSTSVTVIVNPLPNVPVITPSNPSICSNGGSVNLLVSNPSVNNNYLWNPGNFSGTSVNVSPSVNTTYTITATSAAGCISSGSVTVTANPVATPVITTGGNPVSFCIGGSVVLNASSGYTSYSWSNGSGIIGTQQTLSVTPLSTTSYTVTVSNGTVCNSSASQTITVMSAAPPIISTGGAPTTFCAGGSVTLNPGSGYSIYQWSSGGTVVGNNQSYIAHSSGIYKVTVTAANGCTASGSATVTVNPNPVSSSVTPSGPITICDDGTSAPVFLNAAVPSSGTIIWNDIFSAMGNQYLVTWDDITLLLNNNTYDYSISFVDANGCVGGSNAVTVNSVTCGSSTLNLKVFLEGYYEGGGMMKPVLQNQGVQGAIGLETDTLHVSLRSTSDPSIVIDSAAALLFLDGTAVCNFNHVANGGSYWIAIRQRSSIETWSYTPVTFLSSGNNFFDFTDAVSKAYAGNMTDKYGENKWSLYCGDINRDGFIDIFDFTFLDLDNQNFVNFVYANTDLNGDGFVDIFDFVFIESNNQNFIFSIHP